MIKSPELLIKILLDYYKSQGIRFKKNGAIIHFDGTLMSIVNVLLLRQSNQPITTIVCAFNQNKYYLAYLQTVAKQLELDLQIKDLTKDFEVLHNNSSDITSEISVRKRLVDLHLSLEADKKNSFIVSNLTYSQWCINFPHSNYQNLEHLHLLNRLFYGELQQLALHLNVSKVLTEREPSFYLYQNHTDHKILGFTYQELEEFLRNQQQPKSYSDSIIKQKLVADNRDRYLCPVISRPSNLLG